MPIDYSLYAPDWFTRIRPAILHRAGQCCEGSPKHPDCRAQNYEPHPVTGSKVVLTIAHVDQNRDNNDFDNLRAWCQRCHLSHDRRHHIEKSHRNRMRDMGHKDLLEEEDL